MQPLHVHFLPTLIPESNLTGGVAVIIDILRASSTIVTALHHGADCVIPCGTPEAARKIRAASNGRDVLLGGERGGVLIDGFDCGNSPAEYSEDRVSGRTIAFTTTNGTNALLQSSEASTILIGSFLNQQAVVDRLLADHSPIHLVCAGTNGEVAGEDVLFAGAIISALFYACESSDSQQTRWILNDSGQIALGFWLESVGNTTFRLKIRRSIESILRDSKGGRNLQDLGFDHDILLCSLKDSCHLVPILNRETNSLVKSTDM